MSVRPSVRPSKHCTQITGRNFEPKLMKFGTQVSYGPGTKTIEIGYDRSLISPSPHTNDSIMLILSCIKVKTKLCRSNGVGYHMVGLDRL